MSQLLVYPMDGVLVSDTYIMYLMNKVLVPNIHNNFGNYLTLTRIGYLMYLQCNPNY